MNIQREFEAVKEVCSHRRINLSSNFSIIKFHNHFYFCLFIQGIDLIKRIFTVGNHRVQLEVW